MKEESRTLQGRRAESKVNKQTFIPGKKGGGEKHFDSFGVFGGQGWGRTNFPLRQECIAINATHPLELPSLRPPHTFKGCVLSLPY